MWLAACLSTDTQISAGWCARRQQAHHSSSEAGAVSVKLSVLPGSLASYPFLLFFSQRVQGSCANAVSQTAGQDITFCQLPQPAPKPQQQVAPEVAVRAAERSISGLSMFQRPGQQTAVVHVAKQV